MIGKMHAHVQTRKSKVIGTLFLSAIALAAISIQWSHSAPARSVPLTVTKLTDSNDGACDSDCSLREALAAAASGDVIVFAPGLRGTITLGETLMILRDVTIHGPRTKDVIISGNEAVRAFYINPGVKFTLSNLVITKCRNIGMFEASPQTPPLVQGGGRAVGGGLYNNQGIVTVVNCTFSDNRVIGGHAGTGPHYGGTTGGDGYGGAIYSSGSIDIVGSTFSGNQALGGKPIEHESGGHGLGGALYTKGKGVISNSTFFGNSAVGGVGRRGNYPGGNGNGGAVYATAELQVVNSTFSGNQAKGGSGGMTGFPVFAGRIVGWANTGDAGDGGSGYGGAIYIKSNASIANCTFYGNDVQTGSTGGTRMNKSSAVATGSSIYSPRAGTNRLTVKNTIIGNRSSGTNCDAPMVSKGYNIDSDGTCALDGPGDLSKTDPKLEPLKQNGGNIFIHALLPSSPAIDGGNPAGCSDQNGALISTDERGRSRSGRCDIGAFEYSR